MANKANELDRIRLSAIGAKARRLEAVLNLCYGGGFEHFSCMNRELQNSLLELAADLAGQINQIADEVEHV
jgi:hypothetical protein